LCTWAPLREEDFLKTGVRHQGNVENGDQLLGPKSVGTVSGRSRRTRQRVKLAPIQQSGTCHLCKEHDDEKEKVVKKEHTMSCIGRQIKILLNIFLELPRVCSPAK
jgi:hypothetical protein